MDDGIMFKFKGGSRNLEWTQRIAKKFLKDLLNLPLSPKPEANQCGEEITALGIDYRFNIWKVAIQ